MDPLLWWLVLIVLITVITVLSLYLCYTVFSGIFKLRANVPRRLPKYCADKTDVEDLTEITSSHQENRISFVNEFYCFAGAPLEKPTSSKFLKLRKASLLTDIHEDSSCFRGAYSVEDVMNERRGSEVQRRCSIVTEGMRRNSMANIPHTLTLMPDTQAAQSTETLDGIDPAVVECLQKIDDIEDQAYKIDYEIAYFIGEGGRNLRFYEINNKLIMLGLALTTVGVSSEHLRKRKKEVLNLINKCKERLNDKAN
ncbi:uncharacterized protein [Euwallacea fornicatus]|uniref:uncharacterized protein n=1 Tax=Euwallacea fornicatus TaxID=995702 RepID=UPI00338FE1A0